MKGKRFLWLTENYPPQRGGMAQSCDRIIDGFKQSGAFIDIFHFTNSQKRNKPRKTQQGNYHTVSIHESESHTINLAWNQVSNSEVYDYLVCYGSHLSVIAAPVFSKWLNIPLITMVRGNDFDNAVFNPRKRGILNDLIQQSDFIFTVSSNKALKIKRLWPEANTFYTPNGISLKDWQPSNSELEFSKNWKKQHLQEGRKCIGLFGDLKEKKGAKFLFECLTKTQIIDKYQFLLIGNIEEELKDYLTVNEVKHENISFQDRYQLLKYYLCLDGLAIPSFYDGMPNVMLEAGALGIPIIASSVDGMKDVIEHNEDGFLFKPGDPDECRKAFYDFHNLSEKEAYQVGYNLQNKIKSKYTSEHETEHYKKYLS